MPLYLDPIESEQQKQYRARQLHVVSVPTMRLVGFAALLLLAYLHNRFVLGSFSWPAYLGLASVLIGWTLLGWLLLDRLYERLGTRLAFALLFGDIAMFALVVYATGGEKSWLFFILVVRSTDVAFLTARQLMTFAHASALAYVLLLAWLAGVEGRTIAWPAEAVKIVALWAICVYLAFTGRIVEALRAQTAAAVRAARDLARRLEEAWRRAEMLSAAKSRFLASMTHELRTPLHAIIGSTGLVQDSGLAIDQRRYFTAIRVSAQSLLYTVNQILDFFRVEAGHVDLERRSFSLRQALEPIVQSLGIRAEESGLDLTVHVDDDVPDELVGDIDRLRQVLINLVDNGLKFTERGGVTVCVQVAARGPDGVSLQFAVTDTGVGIRAEYLRLIFEAFAQAPPSTARKNGGAGLGLAIAAELVRRLGGELHVESEPGRGSTFHFTIAFTLVEADRVATSSTLAATAGIPDGPASADHAARDLLRQETRDAGRQLHVLVIDDDLLSAEIASVALERRGHAVVVARSGREAIEAFDRVSFDAVLMDIQLPESLAAAAVLRDHERLGPGHTRIIVLTAGAMPGDRERCLAAGIDAYLTKPIDVGTLVATIEAVPGEDVAPI